jgi:hypothetical protein
VGDDFPFHNLQQELFKNAKNKSNLFKNRTRQKKVQLNISQLGIKDFKKFLDMSGNIQSG